MERYEATRKHGEGMTIQVAADNEDFYGLPHESVSALNASGKCVTDGETSPIGIEVKQ